MAILTVQPTGVFTKVAAAAGGDSFPNTGAQKVHLTNGHATAPRTVTFDSPGTCSFGVAADANHDRVVVVAALTTQIVPAFNPAQFNDVNGRVQITYSDAAADLTIGVEG